MKLMTVVIWEEKKILASLQVFQLISMFSNFSTIINWRVFIKLISSLHPYEAEYRKCSQSHKVNSSRITDAAYPF